MCVFNVLHFLIGQKMYFTEMVSLYLAHAIPTPQLKELVSGIIRHSKMKVDYDLDLVIMTYLAIIQQWVRSIKILHSTHTGG